MSENANHDFVILIPTARIIEHLGPIHGSSTQPSLLIRLLLHRPLTFSVAIAHLHLTLIVIFIHLRVFIIAVLLPLPLDSLRTGGILFLRSRRRKTISLLG